MLENERECTQTSCADWHSTTAQSEVTCACASETLSQVFYLGLEDNFGCVVLLTLCQIEIDLESI